MAANTKWMFTKEQIANSPSRKYNISPEIEALYRQQSASFIQKLGESLKLPQLCINTAIVYMHRFFMFHSLTKFDKFKIGVATLFLSMKTEDKPLRMEHVIQHAHVLLYRNKSPIQTFSDQYLKMADELIFNESTLLMTLGFDLLVDHPHPYIVKCCQLIRANKDFGRTAYFLATNSLHLTTMCLQYKPTIVACLCIHVTCKWDNWEIPLSKDGKPWFWYIDHNVTYDLLNELTAEFIDIFDKCPAKLKRFCQEAKDYKNHSHKPKHDLRMKMTEQPQIPNHKLASHHNHYPKPEKNFIQSMPNQKLVSNHNHPLRTDMNVKETTIPKRESASYQNHHSNSEMKVMQLLPNQKPIVHNNHYPKPEVKIMQAMPQIKNLQNASKLVQQQSRPPSIFSPESKSTNSRNSLVEMHQFFKSQQKTSSSSNVPQPVDRSLPALLLSPDAGRSNLQQQNSAKRRATEDLNSSHKRYCDSNNFEQSTKIMEEISSILQAAKNSPESLMGIPSTNYPPRNNGKISDSMNSSQKLYNDSKNLEKSAKVTEEISSILQTAINSPESIMGIASTNTSPEINVAIPELINSSQKSYGASNTFEKSTKFTEEVSSVLKTAINSQASSMKIPSTKCSSEINDTLPDFVNSVVSRLIFNPVSSSPPIDILDSKVQTQDVPKAQVLPKTKQEFKTEHDFPNISIEPSNISDHFSTSTVDFSQILSAPVEKIQIKTHKSKKAKKEKKYKKEKKKEKERSKERKKYDVEKNEQFEASKSTPLTPIRISIPKNKITLPSDIDSKSKVASPPEISLKIKIPKERLKPYISPIHSLQTSRNFNVQTDTRKTKISWMTQRLQTVLETM